MNIDSDTHATILLTVWFGNIQEKPLTTSEWAELSKQLKQNKLSPSVLLKEDPENILYEKKQSEMTPSRLKCLLGRGGALGFALEKWQRSGLWVISQTNKDYPERLISRLGSKAPPVLFGYGNQNLLNKGGIAVVGSRNADQEDLDLTGVLGYEAAKQGYSIVSGGARGVDEGTMLGTLENEGTAIGVVANNLLRMALSAKYREHILSGDLALTSPFNPEVGFNVGNAMARNKYIYCLADAAIVVNSTLNKGGTWSGAIECLKSQWVPLWVQQKEYKETGNFGLIEKGAVWLPNDLSSLKYLIKDTSPQVPDFYSLFVKRLLSRIKKKPLQIKNIEDYFEVNPQQIKVWLKRGVEDRFIKRRINPLRYELQPASLFNNPTENDLGNCDLNLDMFTLFLHKLDRITREQPQQKDEIINQLALLSPQVTAWLKRGVEEGHIEKKLGPLRYQSIGNVNK